ncbi:hypothetical protein BGX38DRAFT_1178109 [Terfezia claveryi]|nr:hypothetical protein BGX38DRAFT_1178109 [Terfezia claveryi]
MKNSEIHCLSRLPNLLTTTIFLFLLLTTPISASSFSPPPLFCKCTCGTNSTIIPLDERPPPLSVPASSKSSDSGLRSRWEYPNSHPDPRLTKDINLDLQPDETYGDAIFKRHPPQGFLFPMSSIFRRDGTGSGGGGAPHTCADCTRSFCLGYNLPFCKGVQKEEDVATSCFARDGLMDRVLVWGFVIVTVGLLVWAGIRGWVLERVRVFGGAGTWLGRRGAGYEGLGRG